MVRESVPSSMSSHDGGLSGYRMTDDEVERVLRGQGYGVLSMADGGEAYGLPISFGYDGERLYFLLQRQHERSRKARFVERTTRASFLVFGVAGKDDWYSVVVDGPLRRVGDDGWATLVAAVEDNAWFPSLFSEAEPMQGWLGYELASEAVSGLKGADARLPEPEPESEA